MRNATMGAMVGGSAARAAVAVAAVATMVWMAPVSEARAVQRPAIKSTLHATTTEPGAEGEVEENVDEPPTPGTVACCMNAADQQGCSDLSASDCAAAGGRDLGPGTTCDVAEGAPDPCGDSGGCVHETDGNNNDLRGALVVTASGLAPRAKFGVLVGGRRLGTLKTNAAGRGRKRFRGRKLTVDPRGRRIAVTDAAGTNVLLGAISDPTAPCGVACCLSTAEEQGCVDMTAVECTAAGGVDAGTGTCDPDPCPGK